MTGLQRAKFAEIAKERREMEEPEEIYDLLIEFFKWANQMYIEEKYKFTGIEWQKQEDPSEKETWKVLLIDELKYKCYVRTASFSGVLITETERSLEQFLTRLANVKPHAIYHVLQDGEKELKDVGYTVKYEKDSMGIYIS